MVWIEITVFVMQLVVISFPIVSVLHGPMNVMQRCVSCVVEVELLLSGDYKVRDGGLIDEFKAVRLEFHWSNTSKNGSEHYVNDTAFPLEVCLCVCLPVCLVVCWTYADEPSNIKTLI